MAIGITKQTDRLEWFVEKATEIGVREITLLITNHTGRHKVNVERLNKIAIAALKQSGNVYLPVISLPSRFENFISKSDLSFRSRLVGREISSANSLKLICTATQETEIKNVIGQHKKVIALIGPEGDFTKDELQLAFDNGYQPVSLGPHRLRTETAALTAACALALM
jgi:16S rRNA (uracil1498-N3)-methyltransferase